MTLTAQLQRPARTEPRQKPVVVLGAGVAGLSAARHLLNCGRRVMVIEAEDRCGGFHQDVSIGPYTFDVGSIFYEDSAKLFSLAPGIREMCPTVRRDQKRIDPAGDVLRYPFVPQEVRRWTTAEQVAAIRDLAGARLRYHADGSLETICRRRLGSTIFERTGLSAYITRFNHLPASEVSESFFFHRMGQIERATRAVAYGGYLKRALRIDRTPKKIWPPLHVRPAAGYAQVFDAIRDSLIADGCVFRMQESPKRIVRHADGFTLTTDKDTIEAQVIVSSIPIETMHQALFGTGAELEALDLVTLFVSSRGLDPRTGNVLYNFSRTGDWKRATVYSRIYPDVPANGRDFFSVETTLPIGTSADPDRIFHDFKAHIESLSLASDVRLEGSVVTPDCYPLYRARREGHIETAIDRIVAEGILPIGRQGRFEYLPTSSGVIKRTLQELTSAGLVTPSPMAEAS